MLNTIILISQARSGVTALDNFMKINFPSFCSLGCEVCKLKNKELENNAHKIYSYKDSNLSEKYNQLIFHKKNKNYSEFVMLLSDFFNELNYKYLTVKFTKDYKISDYHLLKIANMNNISTIFVLRNVMDVFISKVKADKNKVWSGVDTTEIKIEVNPDQFLSFYKKLMMFYVNSYKIFSQNNDIKIITYDEIYNNNNWQDNVIDLFNNITHQNNFKEYHSDSKLFKQDKSKNWQDKITNAIQIDELISNHQDVYIESEEIKNILLNSN